jgi:alginate O-acetyltransferase complex protein AlgI
VPAKWRTILLLVASYVFYMSWKPIYGLLIFALTVLNYGLGMWLHRATAHRKLILIGTIVANLVVLGIFKYAYFTHDVLNQALAPTGAQLSPITWQIILPLGISFFVFEFIHYISDIYRGDKPIKSFWQFALFPSFFPTQIAGPIKRYQDFVPQLNEEQHFKLKDLDEGFKLIIFGLFKKVIFADNLSTVVASAFAHPDLLSGPDLWLAVYAFAFQIYFDFSGYTDIARGSAQLFGFKVPINFSLPYLAGSISEFWHRWHISLSTWLRDYLYIPLGGSKGGKLLTYRNLFLTMLLGGLWHGAAMHFVVWGAYQGILLIAHKEFRRLTATLPLIRGALDSAVGKLISIVVTFHVVCIGWVFFRADTFESACQIIWKLLLIPQLVSSPANALALNLPSITDPALFMLLPAIIALLIGGQIIAGLTEQKNIKLPAWLDVTYVAAMVLLLLVFSPDTSPKFIYFQF